MKFKCLFVCSLSFSCLALHSATVVARGGGGADFVVFQSASGAPLSGGFLSIGAFNGIPEMGLGFSDIEENFRVFGSQSSPSGAAGNFAVETFSDNVAPSEGSFNFVGQQIYALVTNSDATEFAFFTADNLSNWLFPTADEGSIDPSASVTTTVVFTEQNNVLEGTFIVGGGPSTFDAIQLTAVPEPSSAMFLALSSLALLSRRPRK